MVPLKTLSRTDFRQLVPILAKSVPIFDFPKNRSALVIVLYHFSSSDQSFLLHTESTCVLPCIAGVSSWTVLKKYVYTCIFARAKNKKKVVRFHFLHLAHSNMLLGPSRQQRAGSGDFHLPKTAQKRSRAKLTREPSDLWRNNKQDQ